MSDKSGNFTGVIKSIAPFEKWLSIPHDETNANSDLGIRKNMWELKEIPRD